MQISPHGLSVVAAFWRLIQETPEILTDRSPAPDAWSLREIVGHLVDSAVNNHQRFVRLGFGDLRDFPGYDAETWVALQDYAHCDWKPLTQLWKSLNDHIIHVVSRLPESAGEHCWRTCDGSSSLAFLVEDYYAHMQLHLEHFVRRRDEIEIF